MSFPRSKDSVHDHAERALAQVEPKRTELFMCRGSDHPAGFADHGSAGHLIARRGYAGSAWNEPVYLHTKVRSPDRPQSATPEIARLLGRVNVRTSPIPWRADIGALICRPHRSERRPWRLNAGTTGSKNVDDPEVSTRSVNSYRTVPTFYEGRSKVAVERRQQDVLAAPEAEALDSVEDNDGPACAGQPLTRAGPAVVRVHTFLLRRVQEYLSAFKTLFEHALKCHHDALKTLASCHSRNARLGRSAARSGRAIGWPTRA